MNDQAGSKYNPNEEVHVILSGAMGAPKVLDALFRDPSIKTEKVVVPGFGERIQQPANIGPESVREDMLMVWKDRDYPGAIGVVKAEGETAEATRVTTTLEGWKNANKLLREFNYHAYGENSNNSWFHNEAVILPGHEGEKPDIIEAFADKEGLEELTDQQKSTQEFKDAMAKLEDEMADDIRGFREKFFPEGSLGSTETK